MNDTHLRQLIKDGAAPFSAFQQVGYQKSQVNL